MKRTNTALAALMALAGTLCSCTKTETQSWYDGDKELAASILSDSTLTKVELMGRQLLSKGYNAGAGYHEVWIRDFNTFVETVMDLVKDACPERIYPVGRLDRNTTGVLLLTNDGDLASKLTHPKFLKKKIYHVYLDHNLTAHDMQQIAEGITLEDGDIKADAIEYASETDKKQVGIEIHSGKNRIVRRIFESLGYKVTKLDRVQFAGLTKKNVRRGDWRYLTEEEVDRLRMGSYE